jgi:uncharacterized GH25 family protein
MLLAVFVVTIMPAAAFAHNLWLNATEHSPAFSKRTGAHTKIYFGFGHKYPVHDFLDGEKVREFKLVSPGGASRDLAPGQGGYLATSLILKKEGAYTVTAATKTGFYTMYRKDGKVRHILGSKEGLENVLLSLYFENYTKALVQAGKAAVNAYAQPVGHNIEIVPVENPFSKRAGDTLDLKVLYQGRPASFCNISATYVGFSASEDYAFSNKTNARGISTIRLLSPGHWVVRAVVRKPAKAELRDKCIEEKYSATITFEVK